MDGPEISSFMIRSYAVRICRTCDVQFRTLAVAEEEKKKKNVGQNISDQTGCSDAVVTNGLEK